MDNTKHSEEYYLASLVNDSKAIARNPQDAGAYFTRNKTHFKLKDYPAALADFSKAIELDPQSAKALIGSGTIFQKLGKPTEASTDFAKYKELIGKDVPCAT